MRRILRRLMAPLARWAAVGGGIEMRITRYADGPKIAITDPYGNVYLCSFDVATANRWTECMYEASMAHLNNEPLLVEDDYETF